MKDFLKENWVKVGLVGIFALIIIFLGVSYYKGQINKQEVIIPKPFATSLTTRTFFACESLIDADIETGLLPPYNMISGRISTLGYKFPFQIEGDKLFLTRIYDGRRFEYKIFSNDSGFLGAADTRPSIYGPSAHTFVLNKSTGLAVLAETDINGSSEDPTAGVSYLICR